MDTTIGVIGLGIMGAAYARNLMGKGFTVIGFDVDTTKLKELEAQGLQPATSPADVGTFVTMGKDLSVIGQYAQSIDCPTPLFSLASNIHAAAVAQGMKMSDTAAVCAVMERLAGVDRSQVPGPTHS